MLAVLMLAHYELRQLRQMKEQTQQPDGHMIDTPEGRVALNAQTRAEHVDLTMRFSRTARAIDDVLLIDVTPAEQEWLLRETYPTALELKMVCQSPQRIQYLDMEVCHDAGGFHTVLYDKRDELRLEGKMGVVRRFPHPSSMLSEQCKYACLTSLAHRANRVCLRRKAFVQQVVQRVVDMTIDGYDGRKLLQLARRFLVKYVTPAWMRPWLGARITRGVLKYFNGCLPSKSRGSDSSTNGAVQAGTHQSRPQLDRAAAVRMVRAAGATGNHTRAEPAARSSTPVAVLTPVMCSHTCAEPAARSGTPVAVLTPVVTSDPVANLSVGNLHDRLRPPPGVTEVRVDRQTPFGNAFPMGPGGRDERFRDAVCEACEDLLSAPLAADVDVIARKHGVDVDPRFRDRSAQMALAIALDALEAHVRGLRAGESLRLMCWCHPKRCHADSIIKVLRRRLLTPTAGSMETQASLNAQHANAFMVEMRTVVDQPAPTPSSASRVQFTLTREMRARVFVEYPEVQRLYAEQVPRNMTAQTFWCRYFRSKARLATACDEA